MAEVQKPDKSNGSDQKPPGPQETEARPATSSTLQQAKPAGGESRSQAASPPGTDAVAMLTADHRQVEKLFAAYEQAGSRSEKRKLAEQVCRELEIHTALEEEIFYPACREAQGDDNMLDEAQVEHDSCKLLIAELRNDQPGAPFYDAKVKVLAEYVKHHVAEEEARQGIFAKARAGGADLKMLAAKIAQRKQQLTAEAERPPQFVAIDPRWAARSARSLQAESEFTGSSRKESTMASQYYRTRDDDRSRGANYRGRDEEGRFTSGGDGGRSSRGRDDDDDRGGRRQGGWFGDPEGHSQAAQRGWDERGGASRSSRGRDDDDDYGRRGSGGRGRDEDGRFTSGSGNGARYSSRNRDDDDDRGRGHGGWFGDPEGHSEASHRGWEDRGSSSRSSRGRDDDDDRYRSSRRDEEGRFASRGGGRSDDRDDDDRGRGQGQGWHGDPEGHSEASRRGWEDRGSSSRSSRGRDDDDYRGGGRSGRGRDDDDRGHGGWFGDPRGHSEASRRGWENR